LKLDDLEHTVFEFKNFEKCEKVQQQLSLVKFVHKPATERISNTAQLEQGGSLDRTNTTNLEQTMDEKESTQYGGTPQSFYDMGKQDIDSINSVYPFKDDANAADSKDTGKSSSKTNEEANEKTFKSAWLRKLQVLIHKLHDYERKEAAKEVA
ncbi:hypothetical protein U1Q18_022669, partial [Sarracenia purpurea var. burkii]